MGYGESGVEEAGGASVDEALRFVWEGTGAREEEGPGVSGGCCLPPGLIRSESRITWRSSERTGA